MNLEAHHRDVIFPYNALREPGQVIADIRSPKFKRSIRTIRANARKALPGFRLTALIPGESGCVTVISVNGEPGCFDLTNRAIFVGPSDFRSHLSGEVIKLVAIAGDIPEVRRLLGPSRQPTQKERSRFPQRVLCLLELNVDWLRLNGCRYEGMTVGPPPRGSGIEQRNVMLF